MPVARAQEEIDSREFAEWRFILRREDRMLQQYREPQEIPDGRPTVEGDKRTKAALLKAFGLDKDG